MKRVSGLRVWTLRFAFALICGAPVVPLVLVPTLARAQDEPSRRPRDRPRAPQRGLYGDTIDAMLDGWMASRAPTERAQAWNLAGRAAAEKNAGLLNQAKTFLGRRRARSSRASRRRPSRACRRRSTLDGATYELDLAWRSKPGRIGLARP